MDSGHGERGTIERRLLSALQARRDDLKRGLEESSNHWGFEDPIYRFYHQSFKVYLYELR